MKTLRLLAGLSVAVALTPLALPQENSEIASLTSKARRGNGIAQYNLGLAYAQGRGVAADPVEAFVWLSLARENGARGRDLDSLVGTLDRATLEAAQRRLSERRAELGVRIPAATPRPEAPADPARESAPATAPAPERKQPAAPAPGDDPLPRLQSERDGLAARVNELTAELAALRAERERLIRLSAEQQGNARNATNANRSLDEQLKAAQARASELAASTSAAQAEAARLRQELAALQNAPKPASDAAALEAKNQELQTALRELEAARSFGQQVEDTLNRVTDQKSVLESALRAAEAARTDAARQIESARAEIAALQAQLQSTATAGSAEAKALADLRAAHATLAAEAQQSRGEIAALTRARDELVAEAAKSMQEATALESQLAAKSAEVARAQQEIAALTQARDQARNARPAYPDLSGKVRELEGELARARDARPAYPNLAPRVAELEAELADARRPKPPAYPDLSARVAELEARLAAAQNAAPAYPDLRGTVRELEGQLTALNADVQRNRHQLAEVTQASEATQRNLSRELDAAKAALARSNDALAAKSAPPPYPDLRDQVATLESQLAARAGEIDGARQEIAALTRSRDEARNARPAYPNLAPKVAELEAELAAARSAAPAYPDLRNRVTELEAQLASAKNAAPAYPDLTGRVAELQAELAQARNAPPPYPDLSRKVSELEATVEKLAAENSSLVESGRAVPELREKITQLEGSLASASADLTRARQEVATLTQAQTDAAAWRSSLQAELAKAREAADAPRHPDLSGKVAELEAALALAGQKAAAAEQARIAVAQQFDDYKSATAAAARERTTLLSNVKLLESDKASLRRQAETAGAEAEKLRSQVAALKEQLAARPAAPAYPNLAGRVAELEAQLAAKPDAPAYPDLSGRVAELEAALASERASSATSRQDLAATISKLTEENARFAEAARTGPAYPDLRERVAELETQLAAAKTAAPSYPDLSDRVRELEGRLTAAEARASQLQTELLAKPAAPAYPDLSGRVAELEGALADSSRRLAAADAVQASLQQQLAEAKSAAQPKADDVQLRRERDELSGRVTELAGEVAQLREDRERMQKMLADAGRQLRNSSADADRIKELEAQGETLRNRLAANQARIAELQAQLAAQPAAPAYPDLSGRVNELERALAEAASAGSRAREEAAALARARDEASAEAREARQELAALRQANESRQSAAPAYPDLRERVASLESALAETHRQLAEARIPSAPATAPGSTEDAASLAKRLQETEDRLTTALRGYALLEKDRDALQARAKSAAEAAAGEAAQLNSRLTALTAEVEQLKAAAAAQPDPAKLAAERDALAVRLSETEARVASAQAEAARATEQLGALQRSSGQTTNEVAAARALIQQLQGSNAVLAQENYQLKTMLARNTGSPAATVASTPIAAASAAPGARTHTVVAGDTLSRISQRYYGSAGRWQEIYNANSEKLGPNGILRVGTELRIP